MMSYVRAIANDEGEKNMKTLFLAAVAVFGLGAGAAYADANSSGGPVPNTFFNQLPGVIAQPPAQHVPSAEARDRDTTYVYTTRSQRQGEWFQSNANEGGANN
jgi:hypothetical protein